MLVYPNYATPTKSIYLNKQHCIFIQLCIIMKFTPAWQIKAGMFNESKILLHGAWVPALKHAAVDTGSIMLGAGLTLTELGTSLDTLESQLKGEQL